MISVESTTPVRETRSTAVAAILAGPERIEVRAAPLPEPGPRQLLVRLEGCGVCASNIPPWQGRPWFNYPMAAGAPGHEGWGRVEKVGSAVTEFALGERVALISNNAYAEYDIADVDGAVRLPPALDSQPFPGEPLGCAMNIFRRSGISKEDTVAIVGIGFLGALLTQLASAAGARVIAISRRRFALEFAKKMGASDVIELNENTPVIEAVKQLTGGKCCDVVVEATGKQSPLDLSAELTRIRGRLVIAGYHQDGARQINMQLWNWRGIDVINAHERDSAVYVHGIRMAVAAVESGLLTPGILYTHTFPLSGLGDALNLTNERPDGFMKALMRL